ncbi:bifunctional hydroxymethylpyrimidine kinase/phosphomethylpyrimidine kinase [Parvularcula lutaonensis]|uniref:hydroxymethylpyrimidine kinase n=1 Tax=Parvularcula lutaonensis TaxID=491923 RepID=A0ABV7MET3_9PROT|nr:bifunctional hydroxymethylpyrimidine kinase/phosphomethylpyrimidine kinase [Parvularcula lutaonensis]GGY51333.1 hydroxymethylpyrimidine/phosphomethylpyrimidine kinase [Parvularcula lutaonensis]
MKGRVLIIAGSDSGGGAGIQADIKAVSAMGAYAATAVTAVTVQDTTCVHAVHDVPPDIIRRQIEVVLDDIGADAIKIGMVGSVAAGEAILAGLADAPGVPVIVDPVLVATSGDSLGRGEVADFLREQLIPLASVVTPNLPELEALSGLKLGGDETIKKAAKALLDLGAQAVLAKGGHGDGQTLTDLLVEADGKAVTFENQRIATMSTHGTGCTLSSALAAGIAQDMPLSKATGRAIAYVHEAIASAPGFGRGHGPVNHLVRSSFSD